jgi:hypothetical protein
VAFRQIDAVWLGDGDILPQYQESFAQGGWRFDFGMSEDIEVGASPDATFYFAVQRGF